MCPDHSKDIRWTRAFQYLRMKARVRKSLKEQLGISGGSMELNYNSSGLTQNSTISAIEDVELRTLAINLQQVAAVGQHFIDRNRGYINMAHEFLTAADLNAKKRVAS
jgi:hypothetical protein